MWNKCMNNLKYKYIGTYMKYVLQEILFTICIHFKLLCLESLIFRIFSFINILMMLLDNSLPTNQRRKWPIVQSSAVKTPPHAAHRHPASINWAECRATKAPDCRAHAYSSSPFLLRRKWLKSSACLVKSRLLFYVTRCLQPDSVYKKIAIHMTYECGRLFFDIKGT